MSGIFFIKILCYLAVSQTCYVDLVQDQDRGLQDKDKDLESQDQDLYSSVQDQDSENWVLRRLKTQSQF